MFSKGTMKDPGLDITIKNNPGHVLSPNDWDMVLKAKFHKVSYDDYRTWYLGVIKERWATRQEEFMELAREGLTSDIKLKCFCTNSTKICHAHIAVTFMNALVAKLQRSPAQPAEPATVADPA